MPQFAYTARDSTGAKQTGVMNAPTERDVLNSLGAKGLFPVEVKADSGSFRYAGRRVKPQLMATTYGQLAALMRSGVPLLRSLSVLRQQTSHAGLKDVLSRVSSQVEEGATLAEALRRHPKVFGEMAVNMVRAGGEGGFLEDALDRVAEFTEKQQDLKSRTMGALAYPIFLGVVGVAVVTVLIVFFVPKFEPLFARLRDEGELPALTSGLLSLSAVLGGTWGLGVLVALIIAGVALKIRLETPQGRLLRDRIKLRLPVVGSIFLNLAVARFCRVLGTLLANGVPILKSLQISSHAAGNRVLADAIEKASENITAGQSLAAPLAASGHFPGAVVEMISVAEEANTLESVLTNIADSLERHTWRRLELFVRLIEPVMLLLLAAVVLVVVIALLVPILKMSMTV